MLFRIGAGVFFLLTLLVDFSVLTPTHTVVVLTGIAASVALLGLLYDAYGSYGHGPRL